MAYPPILSVADHAGVVGFAVGPSVLEIGVIPWSEVAESVPGDVCEGAEGAGEGPKSLRSSVPEIGVIK